MADVRGRIVYIEPNNLYSQLSQNKEYSRADNIAWNPEDLSISVDLQVIVPDRDSCGKVIDTNFNIDVMSSKEPTRKKMQSFMEGNDIGDEKCLTTEYTDISYQEITRSGKGAKECLGIESIDIKFDANFFPQVTMKFVDVRGFSLMQPMEQSELERLTGKIETCQSFFKALFHFPYPQFALSIKGFYGSRVTYLLSVADMKSNFNPSTGNFDVTVNFIGHMYGVYSDIPLNYLIAAPYFGASDGTVSDYWKSQIATGGNFVYSDGKTPIMTFIEFIKAYDSMADRLREETTDGESNYKTLAKISDLTLETSILQNLKTYYSAIINDIGKENDAVKIYSGKDYFWFLNGDTIKYPNTDKFFNEYDYYQNNEKISNKITLPKSLEKSEWPINTPTEKNNIFCHGDDGKISLNTNSENKYYDIISKFSNISSFFEKGNGYKNVYYREFNFDFIKEIDKRLSDIETERKQCIENNSTEIKQITEEILGFSPTIENIFRMIYAHIDAFMHDYYSLLSQIDSQRNNERKSDKLRIDTSNSDLSGSDCFVPPFPGVYEKDTEGKNIRKYPGEMSGEISRILEVDYVNKFFAGIDGTSEKLAEIYGNKTEDSVITEPPMTQDFIPTILTDIFYEGKNPYYYLTINEGEDAFDNLLYFFTCRSAAAELIGKIDTETFVENEAKNFDKYFHKKFVKNDEFKEKLNNFSVKDTKLPDFLANSKSKVCNFGENLGWYGRERKPSDYKVVYSGEMSQIPVVLKTVKEDAPIKDGEGNEIYEKRNIYYEDVKGIKSFGYPMDFIEDFIQKAEKAKNIQQEWTYNTNEQSGLRIYEEDKGKFNATTKNYDDIVKAARNGESVYVHKLPSSFGYDILSYWNNRKKALNELDASDFLSTLIGSNNVYRIEQKAPGIIKMPRYVALYLGAQIYRKEFETRTKEWPFSVTTKGEFTFFKKGYNLEMMNGKKINDIINFDTKETLKTKFSEWYENEFNKLLPLKDDNGKYKIKYTNVQSEEDKEYDITDSDTLTFVKRLTDFYLEEEYYFTSPEIEKGVSIPTSQIKAFCTKVWQLLGGNNKQENDTTEENNSPIKSGYDKVNTKEEFYYKAKNLYDKWLSCFNRERFKLNSPDEDRRISREKELHNAVNGVTEFNSFIFRDAAYRDIGDKFMIDPETLYDLISSQMTASERKNRSVIEFISDIAQKNKLVFLTLPVFNNLYDKEGIVEMFTPHSLYDGTHREGRGVGNTYVLLYPGQQSYIPNIPQEEKNGVGYKSDSFDLADSTGKITDEALSTVGNDSNIMAFGVTFAKQNQMYFTSISPSMDNPRETDYSIANKFYLAENGANGNTKVPTTVGQNMYSIYSNRSYDCTVDMLGCANIMPLMYFQLNNIPMFKGAYMIYKVEHHISGNKMTTRFTGQRQSKYTFALKSDCINFESLYNRLNKMIIEKTDAPIMTDENSFVIVPTNDEKAAFLKDRGINVDTTFNVIKAINAMKNPMNLGKNGEYHITPFSRDEGIAYCAQATKNAIRAGFDDVAMRNKIGSCNGYQCGNVFENAGFYILKRFDYASTREQREKWIRDNCQPGDVGVMTHGSGWGHVCLYTDEAGGIKKEPYKPWTSDFSHREPWVYNDGVIPRGDDLYIYRFAGNRILPSGNTYVTITCVDNDIFEMRIDGETCKSKTFKIDEKKENINVNIFRKDGKTDNFSVIKINPDKEKKYEIRKGSGTISISLTEGNIRLMLL